MDKTNKLFITFGQVHVHNVNGKTFDKDCVAVINCGSVNEGIKIAFKHFDDKWCMCYFQDSWDETELHFYPRKYINLN